MQDFKIKILLADLGKNEKIQSDLKKKFGKNFKLSVGIDILIKNIELEKELNGVLVIWNVSGENIFEVIKNLYFREEDVALVVFDLTEINTYRKMRECLSEIHKFNLDVFPYILIGNKYTRLKKDNLLVYSNEAKNFAKKNGCIYLEISTDTREDINVAINQLARKILKSKILV